MLSKAEIKQLIRSCRHVLELSLKNGGSSINDYKSPDGTLGSFQNMFQVYQKNRSYLEEKALPSKKNSTKWTFNFFFSDFTKIKKSI